MSNSALDMIREAMEKVASYPRIPSMPKIIESVHLVKIKLKVRGIPAGRKPNRYRPYYREIKVIEYPIFHIRAQNAFICHPEAARKLKEKLKRDYLCRVTP